MESLTPGELFYNVRKAIRLVYEFQMRMQSTVFLIKSLLKIGGRVEVNKLYSKSPVLSKSYGETQMYHDNWAWDYIYPMAMEYHLDNWKIKPDKEIRISLVQVADDGFYRAAANGDSPDRLNTGTYMPAADSDSWLLFVMEIRERDTRFANRWNRNDMEQNLNKWMKDQRLIIDEKTAAGNPFIVMKFPLTDLMGELEISKTIDTVKKYIEKVYGLKM